MKKLTSVIAVVLVLAFALGSVAYAVESRSMLGTLKLDFSGTTAECKCQIVDPGNSIEVTMEIWRGNTFVDSWTESGQDAVAIDETCTVTSGQTYTLIAYGTTNGRPFKELSTSKKCP